MNILFLGIWFPYPSDNGSKLRTRYLLRGLAQRHKVMLLSFAFATARPDMVSELDDWGMEIQTVSVNPFEFNRAGALRTFLSASPVAARAVPAMNQIVAQHLRGRPFDVVIASTGMMATYVLQSSPGATRILEEHNSMSRWMRDRYDESSNAVQRLRCWVSWQKTWRYESRMFSRFDLVTMVSDQDRSVSRALPGYRGRVEVVPNGVDCAHNRPGLASTQPNRLVFNGSLTYDANYDAMQWFLAQVWPRIRMHVPTATLTITGSTAGVDLRGLALDGHVHLTGLVEDVRIPVAEAAVAVAPIRQGGGTRLKILEAMALGTPVVATPKGAEGLDVVDGIHLRLAATPAAFAQIVLALLADGDARTRIATAARHLVEERYDWAQIGQKFVGLVDEAVTRRRVGR